MPDRLTPVNLPDEVVQAAAGRANGENVSLAEVTAALLREYADGLSWINVPGPARDTARTLDDQLVRRIRRVHAETWADETARRGMMTGLLVARELARGPARRARPLPEALADALGTEG